MRHQRFLPWLWSFLKEWVAPKFGIALAVSAVAAILFSMDPSIMIQVPAQKRFDSIFSITLNPWYKFILALVGAVFLACLAARHWAEGRNRQLYFLDRNLPRFAQALNLTLGVFLVPMVVSISALYYLPGDHSRQLQVFMLTSIAFIGFGAGFHFLGGHQAQPRHSITYTISPSDSGFDVDRYHYQTHTRLAELISHVPWHAGPIVAAETFDYQIVLVIPIYLHISSWKSAEKTTLGVYLSAVELEWKQANFTFQRSNSLDLAAVLR